MRSGVVWCGVMRSGVVWCVLNGYTIVQSHSKRQVTVKCFDLKVFISGQTEE